MQKASPQSQPEEAQLRISQLSSELETIEEQIHGIAENLDSMKHQQQYFTNRIGALE